MINIEQLFKDFGIQYQTHGHKHCRPGWVNTSCFQCTGNPGLHLGYCVNKNDSFAGRFVCWRCGGKTDKWALSNLLNVPIKEAEEIAKQYSRGTTLLPRSKASYIPRPLSVEPPHSTLPLTKRHKKYLIKRGFKPRQLVDDWKIQSVGHLGGIYKFRVFIPIYHNYKLVSYQCRDTTDQAREKYLACEKKNEVIEHKHCLYGFDEVPANNVVIVEGVTDVWRLGYGAVATFGIKFRPEQLELLTQFENKFILYDSESQAIKQAEKMGNYLSAFPGTVELLTLDKGDPGELPQAEADELMQELLNT